MSAPEIIVGAGGHGRVLADALQLEGRAVAGFVDPGWELKSDGLPILGDDDVLEAWPDSGLVNGIGGPAGSDLRRRVQTRLEAAGRRFYGVRHPSAIVAVTARIDPTVQLLARAVVQPGATLEAGVVINTGAIVEHDCVVGAFTHCAPGSILCGGVTVGDGCHIGAGAVIREGVRLGDGIVVGAGAVVVRDCLDAGVQLLGVPAERRGTK